jgi:hypothetical protein
MINIRYTTPTMLRQHAAPGVVCRVALLQRFVGRIASAYAAVRRRRAP